MLIGELLKEIYRQFGKESISRFNSTDGQKKQPWTGERDQREALGESHGRKGVTKNLRRVLPEN